MKWMALVSLLLVFPLASVAAPAQVSHQDKTWLKAANQVNLEEMQSGALAQQKGNTDSVRSTGQTLASDHQNLDAQLKPVAQQLGVSLPTEPTSKARRQMKKLQGKQGAAFDTAYVQDEIKGHKQAIAKTKKEIDHGSSMQVKQLAQQCLPVLEKHLQMLQHDADAMHGST
ncbi:MAG TPA: DUF4142 domain-containing protein [Rhodanobacteraceae bacterium]